MQSFTKYFNSEKLNEASLTDFGNKYLTTLIQNLSKNKQISDNYDLSGLNISFNLVPKKLMAFVYPEIKFFENSSGVEFIFGTAKINNWYDESDAKKAIERINKIADLYKSVLKIANDSWKQASAL